METIPDHWGGSFGRKRLLGSAIAGVEGDEIFEHSELPE
jgi:hypothetical protein